MNVRNKNINGENNAKDTAGMGSESTWARPSKRVLLKVFLVGWLVNTSISSLGHLYFTWKPVEKIQWLPHKPDYTEACFIYFFSTTALVQLPCTK